MMPERARMILFLAAKLPVVAGVADKTGIETLHSHWLVEAHRIGLLTSVTDASLKSVAVDDSLVG